MPLMTGKSPESFSHNVKAEMDSGKPQKQALAIAYSVKRKAKKKMANGGEVENEKLHPMHEAPHIAEDAVMKQQHMSHNELAHGNLTQPQEPMEHEYEDMEDQPHGMLGNIAKAIMAKRMAQGGELTPEYDYLDENDSYPDPEYREFDPLDPHQEKFADGGEVKPSPTPTPSPEMLSAQTSMRKAFKFADGGMVDMKKKRLAKIMGDDEY